jgi:hypothetical protein
MAKKEVVKVAVGQSVYLFVGQPSSHPYLQLTGKVTDLEDDGDVMVEFTSIENSVDGFEHEITELLLTFSPDLFCDDNQYAQKAWRFQAEIPKPGRRANALTPSNKSNSFKVKSSGLAEQGPRTTAAVLDNSQEPVTTAVMPRRLK